MTSGVGGGSQPPVNYELPNTIEAPSTPVQVPGFSATISDVAEVSREEALVNIQNAAIVPSQKEEVDRGLGQVLNQLNTYTLFYAEAGTDTRTLSAMDEWQNAAIAYGKEVLKTGDLASAIIDQSAVGMVLNLITQIIDEGSRRLQTGKQIMKDKRYEAAGNYLNQAGAGLYKAQVLADLILKNANVTITDLQKQRLQIASKGLSSYVADINESYVNWANNYSHAFMTNSLNRMAMQKGASAKLVVSANQLINTGVTLLAKNSSPFSSAYAQLGDSKNILQKESMQLQKDAKMPFLSSADKAAILQGGESVGAGIQAVDQRFNVVNLLLPYEARINQSNTLFFDQHADLDHSLADEYANYAAAVKNETKERFDKFLTGNPGADAAFKAWSLKNPGGAFESFLQGAAAQVVTAYNVYIQLPENQITTYREYLENMFPALKGERTEEEFEDFLRTTTFGESDATVAVKRQLGETKGITSFLIQDFDGNRADYLTFFTENPDKTYSDFLLQSKAYAASGKATLEEFILESKMFLAFVQIPGNERKSVDLFLSEVNTQVHVEVSSMALQGGLTAQDLTALQGVSDYLNQTVIKGVDSAIHFSDITNIRQASFDSISGEYQYFADLMDTWGVDVIDQLVKRPLVSAADVRNNPSLTLWTENDRQELIDRLDASWKAFDYQGLSAAITAQLAVLGADVSGGKYTGFELSKINDQIDQLERKQNALDAKVVYFNILFGDQETGAIGIYSEWQKAHSMKVKSDVLFNTNAWRTYDGEVANMQLYQDYQESIEHYRNAIAVLDTVLDPASPNYNAAAAAKLNAKQIEGLKTERDKLVLIKDEMIAQVSDAKTKCYQMTSYVMFERAADAQKAAGDVFQPAANLGGKADYINAKTNYELAIKVFTDAAADSDLTAADKAKLRDLASVMQAKLDLVNSRLKVISALEDYAAKESTRASTFTALTALFASGAAAPEIASKMTAIRTQVTALTNDKTFTSPADKAVLDEVIANLNTMNRTYRDYESAILYRKGVVDNAVEASKPFPASDIYPGRYIFPNSDFPVGDGAYNNYFNALWDNASNVVNGSRGVKNNYNAIVSNTNISQAVRNLFTTYLKSTFDNLANRPDYQQAVNNMRNNYNMMKSQAYSQKNAWMNATEKAVWANSPSPNQQVANAFNSGSTGVYTQDIVNFKMYGGQYSKGNASYYDIWAQNQFLLRNLSFTAMTQEQVNKLYEDNKPKPFVL